MDISVDKCDCYEPTDRYYPYAAGMCNGTKERDPCRCGGDPRYCDFYPEKKAKALDTEKEKKIMNYIPKNIDEMTIPELTELCQNPEKYNLKWGEYMKIMDGLERAMNFGKGGSSDAKVQQLEARVKNLENALANMTKMFADVYTALGGSEE